MPPKRPAFAVPWHPSDQPDLVRDPAVRRAARHGAWWHYLITAATALAMVPLVVTRRLGLAALRSPAVPLWPAFAGVGITPRSGGELRELVEELGVRRLLLRLPPDGAGLDRALACLDAFADREVLPVVLQDRALVCDHAAWERQLRRICEALPARIRHLQIGNAVNRLKWGCATVEEYLDLVEIAAGVLRDHPRLRPVGPAIIDFEPLPLLRCLFDRRRLPWAACAVLLYIDRRGGPAGRQFGGLDLAGKLDWLAALAGCAPRRPRLWITEVNWPLTGTGDHCPTSAAECVDEEMAARHLVDYFRIARASRLVDRCYWWQLIHPGYGLVDDRGGIRRRPAFTALRELLAERT
jgi:hypothetical protein